MTKITVPSEERKEILAMLGKKTEEVNGNFYPQTLSRIYKTLEIGLEHTQTEDFTIIHALLQGLLNATREIEKAENPSHLLKIITLLEIVSFSGSIGDLLLAVKDARDCERVDIDALYAGFAMEMILEREAKRVNPSAKA